MVTTLTFEIDVECDNDSADELGNDLAHWLEESWFNGEDVVKVTYTGENQIKRLTNELNTYKTGNRLLKKTLDEVRGYDSEN